MAEPTRLDFGAGGPQDTVMADAATSKEFMGRQVLKQVQNVDLNLGRALKAFAPGAKVERDLELAKEDFSKIKFTYQELSAKNDFIRSVVEGIDAALKDEDVQLAEEKLAEGKVALKKTKERCKSLKEEVEKDLANVCHKYQQLKQETDEFGAFVESGNYSDEATAEARVQELEAQILKQQEILKTQEESIRDLSQKKQELSIAVRGLDTEVAELSEKAHPSVEDVQDRRAAAWFENANTVLSSLVGVTSVNVGNAQVDVGFEVTPFSSKESHPAPKAYTLTLEFEHGDERLSGAHITPADVDVSDLVTSFISEGEGTRGVAPMLVEVKARLSCRYSLEQELENLKSRFVMSIFEEPGAVLIEFSPAVGKNASRWRCEVSIDADYPREHVTPELASLRNGSFQSPGMKRERAIIDSVGRAGHTTVTEMLEDVARRLNN